MPRNPVNQGCESGVRPGGSEFLTWECASSMCIFSRPMSDNGRHRRRQLQAKPRQYRILVEWLGSCTPYGVKAYPRERCKMRDLKWVLSIAALTLVVSSAAQAQTTPAQVQIQQSGDNPIYKITVNVVERSTTAVNFRHRGGT